MMLKSGRWILIIFILVLLSVAISACNEKAASDITALSPEATTAASSKEMDDTTAASAAAEPTAAVPTPAATATATPAPAPTPDTDLDTILDKILNMEDGTAGSSLKRAAISGAMLDWVEDSSLSQEGNETQIDFFLASLPDSAAVDLFALNFESVSATVQLIIDGDTSTLGMMVDSGYTLTHASYSQTKWDAFALAVQVTADAY